MAVSDQPPGEWNPGSLHAHFTTRLNDFEKRIDVLFDDLQAQLDRRIQTQANERKDTERHLEGLLSALEASINKTERYTEQRLKDVNRLREQTLEDRGQFATREAIDAKFDAAYKRIDAVERHRDERTGGETYRQQRQQQVQPWQLWVAGALLTIVLTAAIIAANVATAP